MKRRSQRSATGFSLVEVTLALGVFALALVSLLGLLGPALDRARAVRVEQAAAQMIPAVGEALRTGRFAGVEEVDAFGEIIRALASGPLVLYVFHREGVPGDRTVVTRNVEQVREVGSVLLGARVTAAGNNHPEHLERGEEFFRLRAQDSADYPEASLALRVDLYRLPVAAPGSAWQAPELEESRFLFTFHTAVLR